MNRPSLKSPRALAGTAALAGASALGARRHLRALASDPELLRLSRPLPGEPVQATSADGTLLHAEVFGPDRAPTIALVPGWTEQVAFFDYVTRRLVDDGFRVVVHELRGQGRSAEAAGGDYALARYGDDVEAVLAATCQGRDDVLIAGHSLGAMSIAAWAVEHDVPGRVRAVALMNTGLEGLIAASHLLPAAVPGALLHAIGVRGFLGNPLAMPSLSTPVSIAAIRYVAFGPAASTAQVAFYERMLVQCSPKVRAAAGLAMAEMDLLPAVPRIDVPALVLAGDMDRLTPSAHAERIAAALPQLDRLVVMPRTGHMAPLERPYELTRELEEFWQRVSGQAAGAAGSAVAEPAAADSAAA
jgi:pimeloyl-ACP methyl ester carboxylesterase